VKKFKYLGMMVTKEQIKFRKCMLPCSSCSFLPLLLSKNIKIEINMTIILPVVLFGCETWSLTLREKHRSRVFECKVLGMWGEYLELRGKKWQEAKENGSLSIFISKI
jgi:hypothetical protein